MTDPDLDPSKLSKCFLGVNVLVYSSHTPPVYVHIPTYSLK